MQNIRKTIDGSLKHQYPVQWCGALIIKQCVSVQYYSNSSGTVKY